MQRARQFVLLAHMPTQRAKGDIHSASAAGKQRQHYIASAWLLCSMNQLKQGQAGPPGLVMAVMPEIQTTRSYAQHILSTRGNTTVGCSGAIRLKWRHRAEEHGEWRALSNVEGDL